METAAALPSSEQLGYPDTCLVLEIIDACQDAVVVSPELRMALTARSIKNGGRLAEASWFVPERLTKKGDLEW